MPTSNEVASTSDAGTRESESAQDFAAGYLYGLVTVAALREAEMMAAVIVPAVWAILLGMAYGRWLAPLSQTQTTPGYVVE